MPWERNGCRGVSLIGDDSCVSKRYYGPRGSAPCNDTTNAFKAYRREVIHGCHPLIAPHFNLTVELPLKAIVRNFSWTVIPITWRNRRTGVAKLKITEMGSRYLFICLYIWLEKHLSRGDYRRR